MNRESENVFAPDPNIPELAGTVSQDDYGFAANPFDFDAPPPGQPARRVPWGLVAAIGVGIVLLALIAVGTIYLLPQLGSGPELVVQAYYTQLQNEDFVGLDQYIDPDEPLHDNVLPFIGELKERIEGLARDNFGVDVRIRWEFRDLTFAVNERSRTDAKVQAIGKLHIYDEVTGLGPTLPYNYTHVLIKKNGHWYLRP
jgi:hypothetical protein